MTDVRLPGMLHGRVVHPKTLGSPWSPPGNSTRRKFPNAQVIVKGNLVGVVAPTEWEAIQAAQDLAGSDEVDRLEGPARYTRKSTSWLRERPTGTTTPVAKGEKNKGESPPAIGSGGKKTFRDATNCPT